MTEEEVTERHAMGGEGPQTKASAGTEATEAAVAASGGGGTRYKSAVMVRLLLAKNLRLCDTVYEF